jgi:hypothetical protein
MPGLIHHPLLIPPGKRKNKVVARSVVLKPAKSQGLLKALGKVGLGCLSITKIDRIASAVLGVPGGADTCARSSAVWFRSEAMSKKIDSCNARER